MSHPKIDQNENINKTMSTIKTVIFFSIIMGLMAWVFILLLEPLPVVKISTSTGKCVEIEIQGQCYDCSRFSKLDGYEIRFVK